MRSEYGTATNPIITRLRRWLNAQRISKQKGLPRTRKCDSLKIYQFFTRQTADRASRNLDRKTRTASHVLCFSCSSIAVNLRRTMPTIRSISFGATGRVLLCSRSRFTTCVVNSLQACFRHNNNQHIPH